MALCQSDQHKAVSDLSGRLPTFIVTAMGGGGGGGGKCGVCFSSGKSNTTADNDVVFRAALGSLSSEHLSMFLQQHKVW